MADDGARGYHSKAAPPPAACARCALRLLCFPSALPSAYQSLLPLANAERIRLRTGKFLFHASDQQVGVYAVKAGFLKTCKPLADTAGKIVGFHTTGSVLGMDGLANSTHQSDAIAMNDCEVCLIPLAKFEQALEHPTQSKFLRQLLAREITAVETHASVIGSLSAKQRVATFLLDMSACWGELGYSKSVFILFMSRKEIGNFLGLTFETVSRNLSQLQANDILEVSGKKVVIRDLARLHGAAR
jgi:CRP/FNR family transcriptional regulator, anaerobic regulatory protein